MVGWLWLRDLDIFWLMGRISLVPHMENLRDSGLYLKMKTMPINWSQRKSIAK